MSRVVIIGGGITGLSAAWYAEKADPGLEVVLLEKEDRLGGKIFSERVLLGGGEALLLEAGAESFLSRKPAGIELCGELGLTDRLMGPTPRRQRAFISHHRRLHPIPMGFTGLVPGDPEAVLESGLLSAEAKARFLEEPRVPVRRPAGPQDDESLASFMTRRFGREVFERLIEPLASGIYAGDAGLLSMAAAFPQLLRQEQETGSLLRRPEPLPAGTGDKDQPPFVSFPQGMGELVEAVRGNLWRTRILTRAAALAVRRADATKGLYTVELEGGQVLEADAVCLTAPAYEAASLVSGLDGRLEHLLAEIPYASTALINLVFKDEGGPGLDGHGYVVPAAEATTFLACTWSSSKWDHRAPPGYVLVRLYAGRYGNDRALGLDDRELAALAGEELAATVGIQAAPVLYRVSRWNRAIPQFNLGHAGRVQALRAREALLPGFFLAGAALDGVGIPDCIRAGKEAAGRLHRYLHPI